MMVFLDKDKNAVEDSRNFKYLDELIHSGAKEIILDSNIVLDDGEESEYLEGIKLDVDGLVFDGNNHRIDAGAKSRIFKCTGKNVTIKNAILENGFNDRYGGAICNSRDLTIVKSALKKNKAFGKYYGYGGAIFNEGGKLTIIESALEQNIATSNGGAIYNKSEMSILKSRLEHNSACYNNRSSGGAIYNEKGNITIEKSVISRNDLKGLTVWTSSHFCRGGALYNNEGIIAIIESAVTNNIAHGESSRGGAIYNTMGEITVFDSKIACNESQDYGGAIFNEDGKLTIIKSLLSQNAVKAKSEWVYFTQASGGAIYNIFGSLTVDESSFEKNFASNSGGAINIEIGEISIAKSSFTENTAKVKNGGAILNHGGELNIVESDFIGNSSIGGSGGAIQNANGLTIRKSSFNNNNACYSGGAIIDKPYWLKKGLNISESTFKSNTSSYDGAVTLIHPEEFELKECTFINNSPDDICEKSKK